MVFTKKPPLEPSVLLPCPKCGAPVLLRAWEKAFTARCSGPECRFGFDADRKGRPTAPCPSCEGGRLKTTPKGQVCADCGRWDDSKAGTPCPKCQTGRVTVKKGEYGHFAACSDPVCGLTYTVNEAGKPEGGHCRFCKGPVKKARNGSGLCVVCEQWHEPKVPSFAPRPPAAACANCGQPRRVVKTKKQTWIYRCDPCARWQEVVTG